jgi:capsular exopolysaccharide synthesis family protein
MSLAYISATKPLYEAFGTVRIDPNRSGSLGLTDALGLGSSSDVIPTEIGVLTSDQVALSAMESLTSEQFQEFAGFAKTQMVFNLEDAEHRPLHLNSQQADLLDRFKRGLAAKQQEGTQLVALTFRDHNPDMTALLLNRTVDAYQRKSFDSRYESVAQVRSWLSVQMNDLQKQAATAQQKLAGFQESNGLVGTDPSNNTIIDRLKLLNERLTMAEGDRIVKEAQLRAAVDGDPAVLASLLPDTHLQELQATEATLDAQEAQLAAKFGHSYPPLVETRTQLAKVRQEIKTSISAITAHLNEDFDSSRQVEAMLRRDYEGAVAQAYALNRKLADYAVLLAEGTSSRDLYDTLQYKLQQATVNAGLDSINTMVVDRARVEKFPVEPKKTVILASGLILGLAAGIAMALLKEALGGEIQTIAQIENSVGLASLSTVPHMNWDGVRNAKPADRARLVTMNEPRSRAAESYRTLRNSVLFSSIDRPPKLMLITSCLPKEGKSSTTANYAIVLAQSGAKVLVIDADLRRPTLHQIFGVANRQGLSDHLVDSNLPQLILQPIPELPNLHFLPAGQHTAFPSEMLGAARLRQELEQWAKEYDNVLMDSAPLLTVGDSLPLATWADTTVMVARAGLTPLKALIRGRAILLRAHARIAGVVLNDISHAGQDSGYYGKDGYGYYN